MSSHYWSELYTGPWTVTGNVAKVKVLHELHKLISQGSRLSILDVGVVGLTPLEFWEPLLESDPSRFHLTGVDVWGIEKAQQIAEQRGWKQHVTLHQGSGYALNKLFEPGTFDLVVATQVLEHVARLPRFLQQMAEVMRGDAEGFFTIDSAHYRSRFDMRDPVRLARNLVKKSLSLVRYEKRYDLPWMDHEVVSACERAGLKVRACRYYNLHPLKFIHNHIVPNDRKNAFMRVWFDLEEFINELESVSRQTKHLCMALYIHVVKV